MGPDKTAIYRNLDSNQIDILTRAGENSKPQLEAAPPLTSPKRAAQRREINHQLLNRKEPLWDPNATTDAKTKRARREAERLASWSFNSGLFRCNASRLPTSPPSAGLSSEQDGPSMTSNMPSTGGPTPTPDTTMTAQTALKTRALGSSTGWASGFALTAVSTAPPARNAL